MDSMIAKELDQQRAVNKKRYDDCKKQLSSMTGFKKVVAEQLFMPWLAGSDWCAGLTIDEFDKIAAKIVDEQHDIEAVYAMMYALVDEFKG